MVLGFGSGFDDARNSFTTFLSFYLLVSSFWLGLFRMDLDDKNVRLLLDRGRRV